MKSNLAKAITSPLSFPAAVDYNDPSSWPALDTTVINGGRRPAPVLRLEAFGPMWREWITAQAESKSCPPDYVVGGLLATASSLVGNARWPSAWQGWVEPPILWIALVGNPSSGKSPAVDAPIRLLRTLEDELVGDFTDRLRQYETAREAAKCAYQTWQSEVREAVKVGQTPPQIPLAAIEPEAPARVRLVVSDSTPEALGRLLAVNNKGVLHFRDELSGWLGSFDRYGGSGAERALWLEAFGGRPHVIDRVKQDGEPVRISALSLAVLGGIQPDRLASALLAGDDDGLAARFLYIWPESVPPQRPQRIADDASALAALRRLSSLQMPTDVNGQRCPSIVPFSEEAATIFDQWRGEHFKAEQSVSGLLLGNFGKAGGMVLRLAATLEFLWWSVAPEQIEPECISESAVTWAIALTEGYFKPMASRSFGDAALSQSERNAATLARWLVNNPDRPTLINGRELRRLKLPGLRVAEHVYEALDILCEAGFTAPAPDRDGGSHGRQRADFRVNPAIWALTNG